MDLGDIISAPQVRDAGPPEGCAQTVAVPARPYCRYSVLEPAQDYQFAVRLGPISDALAYRVSIDSITGDPQLTRCQGNIAVAFTHHFTNFEALNFLDHMACAA